MRHLPWTSKAPANMVETTFWLQKNAKIWMWVTKVQSKPTRFYGSQCFAWGLDVGRWKKLCQARIVPDFLVYGTDAEESGVHLVRRKWKQLVLDAFGIDVLVVILTYYCNSNDYMNLSICMCDIFESYICIYIIIYTYRIYIYMCVCVYHQISDIFWNHATGDCRSWLSACLASHLPGDQAACSIAFCSRNQLEHTGWTGQTYVA